MDNMSMFSAFCGGLLEIFPDMGIDVDTTLARTLRGGGLMGIALPTRHDRSLWSFIANDY
jgi:hypothetical protein